MALGGSVCLCFIAGACVPRCFGFGCHSVSTVYHVFVRVRVRARHSASCVRARARVRDLPCMAAAGLLALYTRTYIHTYAQLLALYCGAAGLLADLLLSQSLRLVEAPELEQRVHVQLPVDDVAPPPDDARLELLQLPPTRPRCPRM